MQAGKRTKQKEATREKILKTAMRVYGEYGFFTSTSTIAKKARVSHGTIFVHFSTLDDLLTCVAEDCCKQIAEKIHRLAQMGAGLQDFLHTHLEILTEQEEIYGRLVSETALLPPEAKRALTGLQSTVSIHFSLAFKREADAGSVKDIPLHMAFSTWLGLVHYYLQNKELFPSSELILRQNKSEIAAGYMKMVAK